MELVKKLFRAHKQMGTNSLLFFILKSPKRKLIHWLNNRKLAGANSLEERFTLIYNDNIWGSIESISGNGSTLSMTESIRLLLPSLLDKFDIGSIFDAPCGDFNWMSMIDLKAVKYVGGDIVSPLVIELERKFSSETISFIQFDITTMPFPKSDLVLNRDCLFHLSYLDILATLNNFIESESGYFLSTSYVNDGEFVNSDIRSGGFRLIDLFEPPFGFPRNFHFQIPEIAEGTLPARNLYLWDRDQVAVAYSSLNVFLKTQIGN